MALNRVGRESIKTGPAYPSAYLKTVAPIPREVSSGFIGWGRVHTLGSHLKKWAGWYVSLVLFLALIGTNAFQFYHVFDQAITLDHKSRYMENLLNDRAALITAITHDFRAKTIDEAEALLDRPVRKTENGDELLAADQVVFWYRNGAIAPH